MLQTCPQPKCAPKNGMKIAVAFALIVVGAEPVEAAVERDVPGIAEAARHDFEVRAAVVAAQHAAFASPVVAGILIGALVLARA